MRRRSLGCVLVNVYTSFDGMDDMMTAFGEAYCLWEA